MGIFHGKKPISRKMSRPWNRELGWSLCMNHLCKFASKSDHSFSKYHVNKCGDRQTDGQHENIMPPLSSLAGGGIQNYWFSVWTRSYILNTIKTVSIQWFWLSFHCHQKRSKLFYLNATLFGWHWAILSKKHTNGLFSNI